MGMPLSLDLSLGDVIKIVVIAGGWIVTIVKIDGRLRNVERDIKEVTSLVRWRERIEERIMTLRRDTDDLRRGRGFIVEEMNEMYRQHEKKDEG